MVCTFTVGAVKLDLAGGSGRSSETSNLRIEPRTNFQQVSYIGATEGRQFFRPGSMVTVSFDSMLTFDSRELAEFYLLSLPSDLRNQTDATAILGARTVSGTAQVETATAAGTASSSNNVIATLTAANVIGSPIATTVAIVSGDTPTLWAAKVRTALASVTEISKRFTIGGTGASIVLTAKRAAANDSTLNLALANGSPSPGITAAPSSADTTAGVADTITPTLSLYDVQANVGTAHKGATVALSVQLTGRTTAP